jgi:hypothetical protein|tara:strand:+ start:9026 stop:9907 length:882 start_codon:yes stop_codon:yes gene_type:complete
MKKFGKYILFLLLTLFAIMLFLDVGYTWVYNHGAYRNKAMWVRDMQGKAEVDYIVLGSSRAKYYIDPKIVEEKTGAYGLNLGVNAFTSIEIYLMLEEFLKVRNTKKVFVQVDSKYIEDDPDLVGEQVWIPYLQERDKYEIFENFGSAYIFGYYVPFYRYQRSEARLGYRNVLPSLMGKGVDYEKNAGFKARSGLLVEDRPYIADQPIVAENPYFKKVIALCKENDIELHFFTSPIYGFKGDLSPLYSYLPNYVDLKDSLKDRDLFSDQTHVNERGAIEFSRIFSETFFNNAKD